ncbi:MAG: fasciclin domain-containing protein [Planctomycetota bacterium]
MKLSLSILGAAAVSLFATANISAQDAKQPNIVEVAAKAGSFQTLLAAAKAAGLAETLAGKGPFTVFAPTDKAFAKLGKDAIANLLKPENKGKLAAILSYHVVAGKVPAANVVGMKSAKTVQGMPLAISVSKGTVTVSEATVVKTDIMANNGIIHVIDSVMMPPKNLVEVASEAGSFKTLLAAAKAAGLAGTLSSDGPFTIFAPTDEAFAKLGKDTISSLLMPENKAKLQAILKHHVVSGTVMAATAVKLTEAKTLNGTKLGLKFDAEKKVLSVGAGKVIKADVVAGNGVIHVVDSVLLPN